MRDAFLTRLSPFRHRHFRNFFLVQTLSMIGTWSHDLARSWIIVEATGSAGALGNLNMAIAVPCLFLILHGGVLVDRTDVRKLIQWTKSFLAVSSLTLAALAEFSHLEVWHLLVFGLIEGCIISFDSPAFQALTVRLVPRGDFQQAIALNSTNFHTSRMIGPVIAAWLMAWHGPSLVFLFDGLTYILVAFVLSRVTLNQIPSSANALIGGGPGLRNGLKYILGNSQLRYRVAMLMVTIGCIYPLMVAVFRVFIQKKFNLNSSEFGTVFSFPAMGSLCGALSFAVIKPKQPLKPLLLGVPMVSLMVLMLPHLPTLNLSVACMTFAGFSLYLIFAALTVSMQLEVDEEFRGRLSSVIGLGFSAFGPLMCFPWGHLADAVGAPATIAASGTVFAALASTLFLAHHLPLKSS